jgi:hypothetical protein
MYFDKFGEKEEMRDETREDTTVSVHMEEIKCDIRALPFVTKSVTGTCT